LAVENLAKMEGNIIGEKYKYGKNGSFQSFQLKANKKKQIQNFSMGRDIYI
jgi:hypothetical protein